MRKLTNFERVAEFHKAFGVESSDIPKFPDAKTRALRLKLIREEVEELEDAEKVDDLIEVANALGDIAYVVYGMAHAYGIDLDKVFAEIHNSNMSKLGADGKPIRREDGKVMKGPGYWTPDIGKVLLTQ